MSRHAIVRGLVVAVSLVAVAAASHAQVRAGSQLGNATPTTTAPIATTAPSWSAPPAWSMPAASAQPRTGTLTPRPATAAATTTVVGKRDLFSFDDRAIVTGDGKQTSVSAIKQQVLAQIAAKAGPMKTVKATPRDVQAVRGGIVGGAAFQPGHSPTVAATAAPAAAIGLGRAGQSIEAKASHSSAIADLSCADKGPPTITEVEGKLRAGGKAKLWGKCFGDRTGRVEVIGQFTGGKLAVSFTSWSQTLIEVDVPATVRGAPDGTVAVSVVTADGKKTPAAVGTFVAARETVEVPDRLWSPTSAFETAATSDGAHGNPAEGGQLARTVRINPQCGLESMVTDVIAGSVTNIDGFERGPPNEAAVTISWQGTCVTTTTWTTYHYVIVSAGADVSFSEACRVALRPRAWAQCPVGIAP